MSNKETKKSELKKKKSPERKAAKKRKTTLAIVVVLIICAVAAFVLYLTGVIRFNSIETVVNNRTGVAYVSQADADMIINSEGRVLEKAEAAPEDIPQITGLELTKVIEGERIEYENELAFDYAMKLVMALRENEILVREININAENEATAYVNKVTILFGSDDKTEIKAADLADFFDQVKDLKGTLHMEVVNDKLGYTFKQESENTAVIQEATPAAEEETTEEEESEEGNYEEAYYEEPVYEEGGWEEEPYNEEEYYEEPAYEEEVYWEEDGQNWEENQEW